MDWTHVLAGRTGRMKASEIRELLKLLDQPDIISFAGGIPDPALFPAEKFGKAMSDILGGSEASVALQYSVSEGFRPLRRWIAKEMGRIGIACTEENVMITSGSQQALDYLGKLLINPGDTALVTWPTYLGALGAFNAYEPTYDQLSLNGNRGAEDYRAAAEAAGGKVKFAYLSPDFANPTGETLDLTGRERLLALAEDLDCAIIEDGAYQALRYEGEVIPTLMAMEIAQKGDVNACRTIYSGSFSKVLAPGLRVAWVVAARDVIDRMVLLKQAADLHSATLNQIATLRVAEQDFDAHVAGLREVYGRRRRLMLAALDREMPEGVTYTRPEGGMFVWMELPKGLDAAALLATSLESERVAFVPGSAFYADGGHANTLRLCFTLHEKEKMDAGIARLGRLIRQAMETRAPAAALAE
ncbi:PLP-dependent aminotransferase family protein [Maritimibacter alkaliphilus]|uniref:aminotransferase-like domain-containing protein n=1 Tax=Maritimibacter alkaliphilus TaxID=404236 RepID=UPI001C98084D|nr:PLP-dependent aminotransferase family protein [Maritimibacter alkaliphilus]MBY6090186.1 PLP-dependent aminotransferase family protein [Maritimibacter alkaliphilus]